MTGVWSGPKLELHEEILVREVVGTPTEAPPAPDLEADIRTADYAIGNYTRENGKLWEAWKRLRAALAVSRSPARPEGGFCHDCQAVRWPSTSKPGLWKCCCPDKFHFPEGSPSTGEMGP